MRTLGEGTVGEGIKTRGVRFSGSAGTTGNGSEKVKAPFVEPEVAT